MSHETIVNELPSGIRGRFTRAGRPCEGSEIGQHDWGVTATMMQFGQSEPALAYWQCSRCRATTTDDTLISSEPLGLFVGRN